jgi:sugar phosphate isomerase/epimerase
MDMKLANRLGFKIMRPKLGVVTPDLMPDPAWRETIERALPMAEKLNVKIAPEIHSPTALQSKITDTYMELITKTKTKYFGFVIDFSVFQVRPRRDVPPRPRAAGEIPSELAEDPKHLIPLLPYTFHYHAKFFEMTDEFREYSIPYEKVLPVLVESGFDGYLSSEYEGIRELGRGADQLRRQHLMLRQLLA